MKNVLRGTLLTLGLAATLPAVPVTWYLNGVVFADGGKAFGSFVYDANTNTYSAINISTTPPPGTAASAVVPRDYVELGTFNSTLSATFLEVQEASPIKVNLTGDLWLQFAASLTNAGGSVGVKTTSAENLWLAGSIGGPLRVVAAGQVIAANSAGPQVWYIDGVQLDDGGQVVGSFTYDAATNTYSNINIQSTAGSTFGASSFTTVLTGASTASNLALITTAVPVANGRVLNIGFSSALTNAAATTGVRATSLEGSCISATCVSSGVVATTGVVRNYLAGSIVTTTRPAGYSKILSQLVDGGPLPWKSTLVLSNLTSAPASVRVRFYDDTGAAVVMPGIGNVAVRTVPARGVLFLPSTGTSSTSLTAWAQVDNAQSFSVSALLDLKNANSGGDQQAAVYGDPINTSFVSVPYDSTNGTVTGLALTNPDPIQFININVVAYDTTGKLILNDFSISLPPLGHKAFVFATQQGFSALTTGRGTIRIYAAPNGSQNTAPFYGVNALEIKAFQNLAITNVSVTNR